MNEITNSFGSLHPLGRFNDSADLFNDAPPLGVSSVLWSLSSPAERAEMMALGTGASSHEDIIVTHPGYEYPNLRWTEDGGSNGGGHATGRPGAGPNAQAPKRFDNVPLTPAEEAKVEILVKGFRETVASDPRVTYMEAGAAILRLRDGSFKLGPIAWGSLRDVDIKYGQTLDITQVVGAIHSHPIIASVADNNYTLALNPSPNDWASAQQFEQSNGQFYREYIMGPDGNVRKYDFDSTPGQPGPVVAP